MKNIKLTVFEQANAILLVKIVDLFLSQAAGQNAFGQWVVQVGVPVAEVLIGGKKNAGIVLKFRKDPDMVDQGSKIAADASIILG